MNRVKDMLRAGETAIGTTASLESEVRFLAGSGFDFLLFDTQHSPIEIKQLGPVVAAMRKREAIPVIRVGDNRPDQICYALDAGAKGLVVPMVNTPEQAKNMVSWCKYPFEGERSSAGMRGEWGEFENYRDYMDAFNEQLLILPMIETVEALEAIDDIAAVSGVDVLLIGPSDLSINLDVPLDYRNPKYLAALEKIGTACRNANIAGGMFFVPPGIEPGELVELGFRFFTLPWGEWAKTGIQAGLADLR
ncbi:MAG: aldolase/citrate lyase family protein [Pseudomonadota bacterium]|nr:aldolase/citrate lyase family protein [Pseudomonadota bacterium]